MKLSSTFDLRKLAIKVETSPWVEDNLWALQVMQSNDMMLGLVGNLPPEKPDFPELLVRQGYACFIIDPIGQGERLQLLTNENKSLVGLGVAEHVHVGNQFEKPYGSDYFHSAHSLMLDRPYLGQKTFDFLRVIQSLKAQGHEEIQLVGNGWGVLPTTLAAALSDEVKQVTVKHCLRSCAESENY